MTDASDRAAAADVRLTELFTAHHRQVVAYVARRTRPLGDQAVAQDVASEVFALAWRRLSDPTAPRPNAPGRAPGPSAPGPSAPGPSAPGPSAPGRSTPGRGPTIGLPWLLTAAGNVLNQRTRDDARRTAREERAMTDRAMAPRPSASTDPADALALSELVARTLDRMDSADRELLLLRIWDELSFADAAAVLGCSPGAARVRWLRARRKFADLLTREEPDPDSYRAVAAARTIALNVVPNGDPR